MVILTHCKLVNHFFKKDIQLGRDYRTKSGISGHVKGKKR